MSSPISTTAGSFPSMMSMAEFNAWIMFMLAMSGPRLAPLGAHQGALPLQVRRHFFEYVLKHEVRIEPWPLAHRSIGHCPLPTGGDQRLEFRGERAMTLLRPLPEFAQMLLE